MRSVHIVPKVLIGLVALTMAQAALAQATCSSVAVAASTGAPEFKDPKTGQVWTPETVSQDGRPSPDPTTRPSIRARKMCRPWRRATGARQAGRNGAGHGGADSADRRHDNATLRAAPGQRWQAVLYLDNNSGNPVEPVVECHFTNGGKTVMDTRAMVQQTAPSVRQGLVIYGPRMDVFVDRVSCQVTAP